MSLSFNFEWIDPENAKGPELAATWASLEIVVGDVCVTEVLSAVSRSVRTSIFLPLYPIAEWFVKNWWFIGNEPFHLGWRSDHEFCSRHDLRFGGDGYLLPSLSLAGSGDYVSIECYPREAGNLRFLSQAVLTGDAESILSPIRSLVVAVLQRLDEFDVKETFLHKEWARIEATLVDSEEFDFVRIAASLGADPYSVEEEIAEQIIFIATDVPAVLQNEFFAASTIQSMSENAVRLREGIDCLNASGHELRALRDLPVYVSKPREEPWATGYRWAEELFHEFSVDLSRLDEIKSLRNRFGASENGVLVVDEWMHGPFDALYSSVGRNGAAIAVKSARPEARLFAACRAIGDYLGRNDDECGLVTCAATPRQKRNRAFAAEFLAPAHFLRSFLRGSHVSTETIEEVASMLEVLPSVVHYQVKNHQIAELAA